MIGGKGEGLFSLFCQLLQVSSTSDTTSGKSGAAHAVLVTPASVCLPHGWPGRRNPTTPHKPQSCPPPPATGEGGYPETGELQQLPLLYRLCHVSVREERQRATAPGSLDKGVYIQLPPHSPPPAPQHHSPSHRAHTPVLVHTYVLGSRSVGLSPPDMARRGGRRCCRG